MPFGEDLHAGVGGRSEAQKYSITGADAVRQKFTSYQKDTETQLDFAEARMYENRHGRFTAVDPLLASGKSANPQTFNRYVYVMNSPLKFTDPMGLQAGSPSGRWLEPIKPDAEKPFIYVNYNEVAPSDYQTVITRNRNGDLVGAGVGLAPGMEIRFNPLGPGGYPSRREMLYDLAGGLLGGDAFYRNGWDTVRTDESHAAFMRTGATENVSFEFYMAALPAAQGAGSLFRAGSNSFLRNVAFGTETDAAVVYSGRGAMSYADNFALNSGRTTISQTPGGKVLDSITSSNVFGQRFYQRFDGTTDRLWRWGSRHFAEGSSGRVTFFGGRNINPDGVWTTVERPILQQNPNVTGIQRFRVPTFARPVQ